MEIAELPYENIDEWYFMVFGDTIEFVSSPNKPFPGNLWKLYFNQPLDFLPQSLRILN